MYEFYTDNILNNKDNKKYSIKSILFIVISVGFFIAVALLFKAPKDFPKNEVFTIETGATLNDISTELERLNIIKSAGLFESIVVILEGDKGIAAGDYLFNTPINSLEVARKIVSADFGIKKVSVTLPEGLNRQEMSEILSSKLSEFNPEEFMMLTKDDEGYLFPDTYFFFPTDDTKDVVKMLKQTFKEKVSIGMEEEFSKTEKSIKDIMIMASIIEDEAHDGYIEKQTISGILWKRLDKNMRLQVDATLRYVNGKSSEELTLDDLALDHDYNTYVNYGLPPTPISSPGIDSIKAAINPVDSPYFFYLHDRDGKIHYAKTFEEHKRNIAVYLK